MAAGLRTETHMAVKQTAERTKQKLSLNLQNIVVLWHLLSGLYGAVAVFVAFAKLMCLEIMKVKRKLHDLRSGLGNKIG